MKTNVIFDRKAESRFNRKKPETFRNLSTVTVCCEIAEYIASHEAVGIHFDTDCQRIVYNDRITFLLCKEGGFWIITDVLIAETVKEFIPVFIWKQIKLGARIVMAKFLACWRTIRSTSPAMA